MLTRTVKKYYEDDLIPLLILILLVILCFREPIFFTDTINLSLYESVSPLFWIALIYGVFYPLLKRGQMNSNVAVLWGAITYSLFWGYTVIAEPGLRYQDSFLHSRNAELLSLYGTDPSVNLYLTWPGALILHVCMKLTTGLSFLLLSKILALTSIFLTGVFIAKLLSLFFDYKNVFLGIFVYSSLPSVSLQHYSPLGLANLVYLLVLYILLKKVKVTAKWAVVFIVLLLAIIPMHPTTTVFMPSMLAFILLLKSLGSKQHKFILTTRILTLFLVFGAAWWLFQGVLLLFANKLSTLLEIVAAHKFAFSKGIFRDVGQFYVPFYSNVIRKATLGFLLVLILPSFFQMVKDILKTTSGKGCLCREKVVFSSIMAGSFVVATMATIAEQGMWGERFFAITGPVLSVLAITTIYKISKKKMNFSRISVSVMIIMTIMIPLNFIALNYNESLMQTKQSETSAIYFLRSLNIHNEVLFSDSLTLYRFEYSSLNETNQILVEKGLLNPYAFVDNQELIRIPWTLFIRNEKTKLFLLVYHSMEICYLNEPNSIEITKFYDNGNISIYHR